jgi:hypothetical protein
LPRNNPQPTNHHRRTTMPTIHTIAGYNHAVLTADEFQAQGTTAGAIMSIAEHLSAHGQPILAATVRDVARDVAHATGQSLAVPGAVNDARMQARRAANDNRHGKTYGKPRAGRKQERRAA